MSLIREFEVSQVQLTVQTGVFHKLQKFVKGVKASSSMLTWTKLSAREQFVGAVDYFVTDSSYSLNSSAFNWASIPRTAEYMGA